MMKPSTLNALKYIFTVHRDGPFVWELLPAHVRARTHQLNLKGYIKPYTRTKSGKKQCVVSGAGHEVIQKYLGE